MSHANAFETAVGHFWGILDTRDYMRARFALGDTVRTTNIKQGTEEAQGHFGDVLRLFRSDIMVVRDFVPPLMLRLDRDQEWYDFVKWWLTSDERADYDWGNVDLPYLNLVGENALEEADFVPDRFASAQQITSLLLLKLRLLMDATRIRLVRNVIAARLPSELVTQIEEAIVRSPFSAAACGKDVVYIRNLQAKLGRQIMTLGAKLVEVNHNVITALIEPQDWLDKLPNSYSHGSPEEAQLVMNSQHAA
ncbi:hypothetical protein LTR95_008254 [Oleoguttula sp. CCFEE 5521]